MEEKDVTATYGADCEHLFWYIFVLNKWNRATEISNDKGNEREGKCKGERGQLYMLNKKTNANK